MNDLPPLRVYASDSAIRAATLLSRGVLSELRALGAEMMLVHDSVIIDVDPAQVEQVQQALMKASREPLKARGIGSAAVNAGDNALSISLERLPQKWDKP